MVVGGDAVKGSASPWRGVAVEGVAGVAGQGAKEGEAEARLAEAEETRRDAAAMQARPVSASMEAA